MKTYRMTVRVQKDIEVDDDTPVEWIEKHWLKDVVHDWANVMRFTVIEAVINSRKEEEE